MNARSLVAELTEIANELEIRLHALDTCIRVDAPFFVAFAEAARQCDISLDIRASRLADIARRYRQMLDGLAATLTKLDALHATESLDATVDLGKISDLDEGDK